MIVHFTILFVCTGNTCRSPMAEVYCRHLCEKNDIDGVSVISAGIHAANGCGASEMAQKIIELEGLSLTNFTSTRLNHHLMDQASVVIGMTGDHVHEIISLYSKAKDKTFSLMSFLGLKDDIPDPFGGSLDTFKQCLNSMKPALGALLEITNKLA